MAPDMARNRLAQNASAVGSPIARGFGLLEGEETQLGGKGVLRAAEAAWSKRDTMSAPQQFPATPIAISEVPAATFAGDSIEL